MCNQFIVDVEATGPVPRAGVMTELGIVDACSLDGFYVRTYDFHPDPEVLPGFRPVLDLDAAGKPIENLGFKVSSGSQSWEDATSMDGFVPCADLSEVGQALEFFLFDHSPKRAVAISDNPAFDMAFVNDFLYQAGFYGLFGYSARRIGDFYAGKKGDFRKSNDWKRLRSTPHTHHPIADSRGNAQALAKIKAL